MMTGQEPKISTVYNVEVQAPFDARLVVNTINDLVTIPYQFKGMPVSVTDPVIEADSGLWYRVAENDQECTLSNVRSTWVKVADNSGATSGNIPQFSTLTDLFNVGDVDPVINETLRRKNITAIIYDYNSSDTAFGHTPSASGVTETLVLYAPGILDQTSKLDISNIYWTNINSWIVVGALKKSIIVNGPGIGLATSNKEYLEGTSSEDIIRDILTTRIPPIYTQPEVILTQVTVPQDGVISDIIVTFEYNQNDAGATNSIVAELKTNGGTRIAYGNVIGNTITFANITANYDMYAHITINYNEGIIKNDSLNDPYPTGHILASSLTNSVYMEYTEYINVSTSGPFIPSTYNAIAQSSAGSELKKVNNSTDITSIPLEYTFSNKKYVLIGIPRFTGNMYNFTAKLKSSGANITSDIVSVDSKYYNAAGIERKFQTLIFNGRASISDTIIYTFSR